MLTVYKKKKKKEGGSIHQHLGGEKVARRRIRTSPFSDSIWRTLSRVLNVCFFWVTPSDIDRVRVRDFFVTFLNLSLICAFTSLSFATFGSCTNPCPPLPVLGGGSPVVAYFRASMMVCGGKEREKDLKKSRFFATPRRNREKKKILLTVLPAPFCPTMMVRGV